MCIGAPCAQLRLQVASKTACNWLDLMDLMDTTKFAENGGDALHFTLVIYIETFFPSCVLGK